MILSTSDINPKSESTAFTYLLVSIFCFLFGTIYEHFSHGVYSGYMMYSFLIPLLGGALPFLMLKLIKTAFPPGPVIQKVHHCGIATLTLGSIVKGILDIYGTTNSLTFLYLPTGLLLIFSAILSYIHKYFSHRQKKRA